MTAFQKIFTRLHFLIIIGVGLIVYSNTFYSPFQWDEAYFIVGNPAVKDLAYFLNPEPVPGMSVYGFKNRFVGYLTFALNYRIHGFDVFGYHVVNLAIHLINSLLVYFFVLLTFRTPYFTGPWAVGYRLREKDRQQAIGDAQILLPLAPCPSPITNHLSPITYYSRFFALAVALLFVSHPVQTEAVTYIFQRFTSLVSMFYLMSLVLYIKGRLAAMGNRPEDKTPLLPPLSREEEKGGVSSIAHRLSPIAYYLLSLLCAVLAMKTKENAFTLPVVIALYEFLFFSGPLKSRALTLLPFIATMMIIPANIIRIEGSFGEILEPMTEPSAFGNDNLTRWEYLYTQFRVIITYLRLLLFPVNQNVIYDYPISRSLLEPQTFLSLFFLLAVFGGAVYLLYKSKKSVVGSTKEQAGNDEPGSDGRSLLTTRYSRLIAFGILWFFITLSVESSIIPLAMVIDEYRLYLPSVGFFLALMSGATPLFTRFTGRTRQPASAFLLLASCFLVVAVLASAAYARNNLWREKISLWEDVVGKNPNSPKAYNNLGIAYYEKGLYEKAVGVYERAISLNPDNFFAYSNMAVAYASLRQFDRAVENFTKAVALDPGNSVVYANLARTFSRLGRFNEAAENYLKAAELAPYDSRAFYELGSACVILGRLDEALAAYTRFVELSPQDPEAYRSRGTVYAKKNDMRMAAEDFSKACSLGSAESCAYLEKVR